MANIYYDPEDFGMEIVGTLELGGSYEFDTHVLWVKNHKLLYGWDAGCS